MEFMVNYCEVNRSLQVAVDRVASWREIPVKYTGAGCLRNEVTYSTSSFLYCDVQLVT